MSQRFVAQIYCLINPIDNNVFYVGYAADASNRLSHHVKPSRRAKDIKKNDYMNAEIFAKGAEPKMMVLEEVDATNWREREKYWIALLISQGHRLTNESKGGEGPNKWKLK